MKKLLVAIATLGFVATANASDMDLSKGHNVPDHLVNWFVSTKVSTYGPQGNGCHACEKLYGDDLHVVNPHIKDIFVQNKDANGNVISSVYSHSVIRFTDVNRETYNITFVRTPVVK